jgi:hypothetical protein
VIVEGSPARTVVGFAEHDAVGGCFGGSFTVKFEEHVSGPWSFFGFESVAVAVTVYCPGASPVVSTDAPVPLPVTFPPVLFHSYVSVCFGGILVTFALTDTGSPASTDAGDAAEHVIAIGGNGGAIPKFSTIPVRRSAPIVFELRVGTFG